jgi:capsular polysaccharide biosynthesis protein
MPLSDYFRILWRRGWILALMAVLTAAAAFVFSKLQTPVYQATVYVLVKPSRTDFGLTQSAKILLRSYVAWMDTDSRAQEVINALQIDKVPAALRGDVTIASDDSRFVIQVDAESENQQLAGDVAQKWAELFVQWRDADNQTQRKEDRVEAEILDAPRLSLDRPKTTINTLAGAILGILLGGVIVFVIEYIESAVIRSAADIERQFSLPVLGAIPVADRKKI